MKKVTKIEQSEQNMPAKNRLRVAAYCRVSTDSDAQLESLSTQKAYFENYISSRSDWELVDIYFDEGITGTKKEKRPGLMRMLQDCENHMIDFIITKSLSRFSRNTTDCLELVRKLQQLNIPLFFERENLNTADMESELILTVLSSMAEGESSSTSQNTKWSVQKRFQSGTYKLSYPPYGYDWNGEKMVVNEEQAKIVKEIYSSYLLGMGMKTIADSLNKRGVQTKRGEKWSHGTINGILTNEKYTGDVIFQKTYSDDSFIRHRNNGEKDKYFCPEHHEAIISHEDFDKVTSLIAQRRAEKNIAKDSNKYQRRYCFSGKIVCGECGNTMRRRINSNGKNKYPAWLCNTHLNDSHACSMLFIKNELIEQAFVTMLNKLIFAKNAMLRPLLQEIKGCQNDDGIAEIRQLEQTIMQINEQRDTLQRLMAQGYLDQVLFTKQKNDLLAQSENCRARIETLRKTSGKSSQLLTELNRLIHFAEHSEPLTEFDEGLFTQFVDRVIIYSRQELAFELKCGLLLKERM